MLQLEAEQRVTSNSAGDWLSVQSAGSVVSHFCTTIDGSSWTDYDSASTVRIFCSTNETPVFQGFTVIGGQSTVMRDPTEGQDRLNGGGFATRLGGVYYWGPAVPLNIA